MKEATKNKIAAEIARQIKAFMDTEEFARRAAAVAARLDAGEKLDDAALADGLGLPTWYVAKSMAQRSAGLIAENGGLQ
jgi:hypothetical protein